MSDLWFAICLVSMLYLFVGINSYVITRRLNQHDRDLRIQTDFNIDNLQLLKDIQCELDERITRLENTADVKRRLS
jgi:hypothetical protein